MKIKLEDYTPDWAIIFNSIRDEIQEKLEFLKPVIEHVGSTSVAGLHAKPIIDVMVGIPERDRLDEVVGPLLNTGYLYYEKYNSIMPYRRFFVKLKNLPENFMAHEIYYEKDEVPVELHEHKLAHVHVLGHGSCHWTRHIAFRDFLIQHDEVKDEYQELKMELCKLNWKDGNEYNAAKNDFIQRVEKTALEWYKTRE